VHLSITRASASLNRFSRQGISPDVILKLNDAYESPSFRGMSVMYLRSW
jgi:hypothetical protein